MTDLAALLLSALAAVALAYLAGLASGCRLGKRDRARRPLPFPRDRPGT